jgi:hypothetical protein
MSEVALPSRQGLLLRVGGSLCAAAVIVIGFILPAEYHIDPTGFGRLTGLVRMSQTPASAAGNGAAVNTTAAHTYSKPFRTDEVDLSLVPGDSYEYKVRMKAGETLLYSWKASEPLEFDFHGESDKDPDNAVSYTTGNAAESDGSLIAPVQGIHGWYWKNNGKKIAEIHIKMSGQYELTVDFSQ